MPIYKVAKADEAFFYHGSPYFLRANRKLMPHKGKTIENDVGRFVFAHHERMIAMAYLFRPVLQSVIPEVHGWKQKTVSILLNSLICRLCPEDPFAPLKNAKGTLAKVPANRFRVVLPKDASDPPTPFDVREWVSYSPTKITAVEHLTLDDAVREGIQVFYFNDTAHLSEKTFAVLKTDNSFKTLSEMTALGILSWVNGRPEYANSLKARPCFSNAAP